MLIEQASRLLATLNSSDFLQKGTVHAGFLWVHQASKVILFPTMEILTSLIRASHRAHAARLHLVTQELSVVSDFLLASLFGTYTFLVVIFDLLGPSMHV